MPPTLDPQLKRALADRIRYYNELGIYDFYRRDGTTSDQIQSEQREPLPRAKAAAIIPAPEPFPGTHPNRACPIRLQALLAIREDIGDCTRCRLAKQGRKQIVFGVGNPRADLMFIGEAPGADEDSKGEPFVGRAGQLLNNMIKAMGLSREEIYIANIIKCRPPGNRTPERDECETCSPFLMRQIEAIKPKAHCGPGRGRRQNPARHQCPDDRTSRQVVRLPRTPNSPSPITRRFCCAILARRKKPGKTCKW